MKKVFGFIIFLLMCLSFTSCAVVAEAQVDDVYVTSNGVDVDIVIRYGTPYYNAEGLLLYYIYRDLYYYPYYHGSRWYFRSYTRPIHYYRPVPRDFYRHKPVNHVRRNNDVRPPMVNRRSNGGINRSNNSINRHNGSINRPNQQIRGGSMPQPRQQMNRGGGSSSRSVGHFGGSRR